MTALLLDTNALLWLLGGTLSPTARSAIDANRRIFVSHVAFWEIAIKATLKKLPDNLDGLEERLIQYGIVLLPIALPHIIQLRALPLHHRDPFDRMLIAQAMCERLTIITGDRQLQPYGVPLIAA